MTSEKTFRHTRYEDVLDARGKPVFAREQYYTSDQVIALRFCSFRKEEQGNVVFCCSSPLRHQGDRLCKTHFGAWKTKKEEQEVQRQQRREEWFERECNKEFEYMKKNPGNLTFPKEATTQQEKDDIMWQMAEEIVAARDKYAVEQEN